MNQPLFDFDATAPVPPPAQPEDRRPSLPVQATTAPGPRPALTAEVRAGYIEQILRDEQTLRLGLATCPGEDFYRERIAAYKADL